VRDCLLAARGRDRVTDVLARRAALVPGGHGLLSRRRLIGRQHARPLGRRAVRAVAPIASAASLAALTVLSRALARRRRPLSGSSMYMIAAPRPNAASATAQVVAKYRSIRSRFIGSPSVIFINRANFVPAYRPGRNRGCCR
jgi:hypothetical protein